MWLSLNKVWLHVVHHNGSGGKRLRYGFSLGVLTAYQEFHKKLRFGIQSGRVAPVADCRVIVTSAEQVSKNFIGPCKQL